MTFPTQTIIDFFISKDFLLWNVCEKKMPKVGSGNFGWSKINYEDSKKFFDPKNSQIGFRTGIQPSGKIIIGLDFDMWFSVNDGKNKKYVPSETTRKLYSEFELLNPDNVGVFSSSTELNRGVLVDITKSTKLRDIIAQDGRRKIQKENFHLEVLTSFNMVLPPSITKCKTTGSSDRKRQFLNKENWILEIEEESQLETFIYNYINDCQIVKKTIEKTLKSKEQKVEYLNYESKIENDEIYCDNMEVMKLFIDRLSIHRVQNYDEWFKIGFSIKNTFGKNGYSLFKYFSMKDMKSYDEKGCNYYYNKVWENYKGEYSGLNTNYILSCCKNDFPEGFSNLLIQKSLVSSTYDYIEKKELFEKSVRKVLEPNIWIKKNRVSKKWEYCDTNEIIHTYIDIEPFDKDFIDDYIDNKTLNHFKKINMSVFKNKKEILKKLRKQKYDTIDFIPEIDFSGENDEGLKIFNMFEGYKIKEHTIEKQNNKWVELFKEHLNVLVNYNEDAYKMLQQWISNLIFNTTKRPGICIILKGVEGSGKTTLYELINKLIGDDYCFQTARPEKTIFTQFNSCLKNKILVNINEPDFNSFKGGYEEFKSLITDSNFSIEEKNKPKISLSNNMWFLLTTNNDKLFSMSLTERRFYFVETSGCKVGNKDYFNQIYDMFNNKDAMKHIFDYLKNEFNPDFDFQHYQKNCKTDFHKLLNETSQNPFYEYFQDLLEVDIDDLEKYKDDVIIQPKDILKGYKKYCVDNSLSCNDNGKSILLKLSKMGNQKKKLSKYNQWYYLINVNHSINWLKDNKYYKN